MNGMGVFRFGVWVFGAMVASVLVGVVAVPLVGAEQADLIRQGVFIICVMEIARADERAKHGVKR